MGRPLVIKDIVKEHKHLILEEVNRRIDRLPVSPYREFLLNTKLGQHRLTTWVDLIIGALDGEVDIFLKDQEDAGYQRAIQGFQLLDVSLAYHIYLESCLMVARKVLPSQLVDGANMIDDLNRFTKLCFKGHSAVAASFLRTQEEIISEKVTALQELLDFTRQIVTSFDVQAIIHLGAEQISSTFGGEVFVTVRRNGREYHTDVIGNKGSDAELAAAIERSLEDASLIFVGDQGNCSADVDEVRTKRIISAPIGAQGRAQGALAIVNREAGIDFNRKELTLLLQFVYIVSMALENAFMVEEIEQSRGELNLLASKLITIKEEERKILAADIHDTVAQALAAIGYKIQYCSEAAKIKPEVVTAELQKLLEAVNLAIRQCRELISNLRPNLIDTHGLVPALRKLFENYSLNTQVEVSAQLPEDMDLPGDKNICLYRVAQEALMNAQRHSKARAVWVKLSEQDGTVILVVSDDGKGFDISEHPPWMKDTSKVGLLYMRQRVDSVGGVLVIETSPNEGCTLTVNIPYEGQEKFFEQNKDHDRRRPSHRQGRFEAIVGNQR